MNRWLVTFASVAAMAAPASAVAMQSEEIVEEGVVEEIEEARTCRQFRPTGSRARVINACLTRSDWRRVYAYWGQGLSQMMGSVTPTPTLGPLDNPANWRSERREGRVYLEGAEEE
ncbi:hypothetical protein HFP57_17435 [Parasphingopyxis algicola]|uniref:hypothetical protein n=1 Tax=Parasphingopyxis algicola TaxID=2026624 RepID=UPI00159FC931|nr:hypothetical protein [Parasphingopyxis algicola]QLC26642.1 hypothetical protein HFP57_17435 [Parasphingopyxis algicola]